MKFDFSLVTTYLPIVSLCARARVLVVVLYVAMYTLRSPGERGHCAWAIRTDHGTRRHG